MSDDVGAVFRHFRSGPSSSPNFSHSADLSLESPQDSVAVFLTIGVAWPQPGLSDLRVGFGIMDVAVINITGGEN